MKSRVLLDSLEFDLTLTRLCHQIIERFDSFEEVCFLGLQPRGVHLAHRLESRLKELTAEQSILFGELDITFYRDDFRRREGPLTPSPTSIDFSIEGKTVVLIDDVLYTGRTIRAGLDALMDLGRPEKVELMVFIDRRFSRHIPIQPDYIGRTIDSIDSDRVTVHWSETDGKDEVTIFKTKDQ